MNNAPIWKGVESLALALIFAPEPFTTFIGVGLLGYARKKHAEEKEQARLSRPRPHYFTDYYNCKVKMVNGSMIAYKASPLKQGQMPLVRSTISRLYENREEWESFHKTLNPRIRSTRSSNPTAQPGLLKTPLLRYNTGLVAKRIEP